MTSRWGQVGHALMLMLLSTGVDVDVPDFSAGLLVDMLQGPLHSKAYSAGRLAPRPKTQQPAAPGQHWEAAQPVTSQ